jgi:hypothetical protein
MWVGDRGLVHTDVIVFTEIQELFSAERSVIVDDVLYEMMSFMKSMACLELILARGFTSIVTPDLSNKPSALTCMPQYIHEVTSSMVINI